VARYQPRPARPKPARSVDRPEPPAGTAPAQTRRSRRRIGRRRSSRAPGGWSTPTGSAGGSLDGAGDRAIAAGLNRDSVPCPSRRRPEQNRHRLADGWQASTVRAILDNPRYTSFAFFGRWTKHEKLFDPDDVAAGHVTRFRRADPVKIVRSRRPAHPAIVSVAMFTEAQMVRRTRAAGGLAARRKLERGPRPTSRPYALRGRVRCGYCGRRMEGTPRENRVYYRCAARSIVPGAPVLVTHPKNVYLPESAVVGPINAWIGSLFGPEHREGTVRRLLAADANSHDSARGTAAAKAVADAERRLRAAVGDRGWSRPGGTGGADQPRTGGAGSRADRKAGHAVRTSAGRAEVEAMIDYIGEVGSALKRADPASLEKLYGSLRLEVIYHPVERTAAVTIRPGRGSERVRGGSRTALAGGAGRPGAPVKKADRFFDGREHRPPRAPTVTARRCGSCSLPAAS
jgi:hypothetical protein